MTLNPTTQPPPPASPPSPHKKGTVSLPQWKVNKFGDLVFKQNTPERKSL